jgi:hypothetical protein
MQYCPQQRPDLGCQSKLLRNRISSRTSAARGTFKCTQQRAPLRPGTPECTVSSFAHASSLWPACAISTILTQSMEHNAGTEPLHTMRRPPHNRSPRSTLMQQGLRACTEPVARNDRSAHIWHHPPVPVRSIDSRSDAAHRCVHHAQWTE